VYAWYCDQPGNSPDTPDAFKKNVFQAGSKEHCIDDTVNICYNKKETLFHNDVRILHGSPGLTFNRPLAKAAQTYLKEKLGAC